MTKRKGKITYYKKKIKKRKENLDYIIIEVFLKKKRIEEYGQNC